MNDKRKTIFKEALFTVPFLLVASVVTFAVMFKAGRTPLDMEQLVTRNVHSDSSLSADGYINKEAKAYKLSYYYGDSGSEVLFAEFEYKGKGDTPESTLTLYEARDGFDPGIYSTKWFVNDEYVMYSPLGSSEDAEAMEKYYAGEAPLMTQLVRSYSWSGALEASGAADGKPRGYSLLGIRLFTWDLADPTALRENFMWGIGGNPIEMYSYIQGTQEYKKIKFS